MSEPATETVPDATATGTTDTATAPTSTDSGSASVGLVPVAGVSTSALSAGSAALFAAAGPLGLVAGGAAVVAGGALLARRKFRASQAGVGRAGKLSKATTTSMKRSGGMSRPAGSAASQARKSAGVASGAVAARKAAAAAAARRGAGAAGASGRRAGASRPGGGGSRPGWAGRGGATGRGRTGGGLGGTKKPGTGGGSGRGSALGRPHGGIGPRATGGGKGKPTTPGGGSGRPGRTGSRWGGSRPATGGLNGTERRNAARARKAIEAGLNGRRSRAARMKSRIRSKMARSRTGRVAIRSWRAVAWAGAGIGALAAGVWAIGRKSWRWVTPHLKRAGTYLAGAWSELLLKGKRRQEKDRFKRDFEPGTNPGTPGREVARRMSGASHHRVMLAAHELANAISAYNEEGMLDYVEGLDAVPEALEVVSGGINNLAVSTLQEQPLDPRIGDFISGIATGQGNIALAAMHLRPMVEQLHEPELTKLRNESGVPNSHKWDHAHNQR